MEKHIFKFTLSLILLMLMLLILTPYFTSSFLDLRQERENKENYQKLLEEQRAQKEAEEKIYLMGKFDPAQRDDFTPVPEQYAIGGNKMYLRKEALGSFLRMQNAAEKDGIELKIASATRNFIYQKNIWDNKWTGYTIVDGEDLSKSIPDGQERFRKILEYSAVPGTSRHHWGTDIDINDANPSYFKTNQGAEVYAWLTNNADRFGFCQPYNLKGSDRPTGYNEEKWHWSYLPLARTFTEKYKNLIKTEDINGFLGAEYTPEQNLINDYVLGINPECL